MIINGVRQGCLLSQRLILVGLDWVTKTSYVYQLLERHPGDTIEAISGPGLFRRPCYGLTPATRHARKSTIYPLGETLRLPGLSDQPREDEGHRSQYRLKDKKLKMLARQNGLHRKQNSQIRR